MRCYLRFVIVKEGWAWPWPRVFFGAGDMEPCLTDAGVVGPYRMGELAMTRASVSHGRAGFGAVGLRTHAGAQRQQL